MKRFLFTLLALTSLSTFSQTIIFEEAVNNSNIVIINGGNQIEIGSTSIVVAPRTYPKGRVRIGDNVITSDMRNGKIKSMFLSSNKIVVFDSFYGNGQWTVDQIAVGTGCIGNHCVGDSVITSDMRSGTIKGYFSNGDLVVFDSHYGNRRLNPSQISITNGCTTTFCKGDDVITSDNRSGTVKSFFGNGDIVVHDRYFGNRRWNPKEMSVTSGVCSNIYVQRVEYCRH